MTSSLTKHFIWLYKEFGLHSVWAVGKDGWLIILTRFNRMFAYGINALILALFFNALEFTDSQIGLFMTLTLLGDVALSLLLTLIADGIGRRAVLFGGAALMTASGAVFVFFENFWILLFAAVVGVISPTGSEIGPFRAVEESTISHLTSSTSRSDVLAWYVTTATLGSAVGSQLCGRMIDFVKARNGNNVKSAYHIVFAVYTAMGILNMILVLSLSKECELEIAPKEQIDHLLEETPPVSPVSLRNTINSTESASPTTKPAKSWLHNVKWSPLAKISPKSRSILFRLICIFFVDSLGSGMTPPSIVNYWLSFKFSPSPSTLGNIASTSFLLGALSTLLAAPLARRIGLINTMVFTHFPASLALAFLPVPSSLGPTAGLLLFRASLSSMDQAPRSAFVAAVVNSDERTSIMGITSTFRTLAQSAGPTLTGFLAGNNQFWIAFMVAGMMKCAYDIALWIWGLRIRLESSTRATQTL